MTRTMQPPVPDPVDFNRVSTFVTEPVFDDLFDMIVHSRDQIPKSDPQILWLYAVARRVLANRYRKIGHQGEVFENLRREAKRSVAVSISPAFEEAMLGTEVLARLQEPLTAACYWLTRAPTWSW